MRITIVLGPFFPAPPAPTGAVEYVWHGLAEAFVRRGHEVTMLCRSHPSQAADETIAGVRYIRRTAFTKTGSLKRDLVKDLMYSARLLAALPTADILVTNVVFLPILGRLRPRAGAVVVAVTRMPKGQMRYYRGAARLSACSTAIERAILEEEPSLRGRTIVIRNPIDPAVFAPPAGGRPANGTRTVLFTGRIHPEKGVHLLIEAFRRLHARQPWTRLKIVGPHALESGGGGEPYLARLRELSAGLPVEICPPIYDRQRLADELRAAAVYTYPTLAEKGEAQPLAPIEAMATGLAPVVSDIPQFGDYIEDGVTGLVFDHRASDAAGALAEKLGLLTADPTMAERLGANAVQRAASFGFDAVAAEHLADFERILNKRGRGRTA